MFNGTIVSYSLFSPPTEGALTGTFPNLTYTPRADFFGYDSFQFTVTDDLGRTSPPSTITIRTLPQNDTPTWTIPGHAQNGDGEHVVDVMSAGDEFVTVPGFANWVVGPPNETEKVRFLRDQSFSYDNGPIRHHPEINAVNGDLYFFVKEGETGSVLIHMFIIDFGDAEQGVNRGETKKIRINVASP